MVCMGSFGINVQQERQRERGYIHIDIQDEMHAAIFPDRPCTACGTIGWLLRFIACGAIDSRSQCHRRPQSLYVVAHSFSMRQVLAQTPPALRRSAPPLGCLGGLHLIASIDSCVFFKQQTNLKQKKIKANRELRIETSSTFAH